MNRGRVLLVAGALGLVVLAVLPYAGARHHYLIHDDRTLLDNAWLAREADAVAIFGHDYWFGTRHQGSDLYRPLTILTLAWNLQNAPGAAAFRTINILLHAAVALLAWRMLSLLFCRHGEARAGAAAWMGAALFAVHPLASESVMFAVGRAELLAAGLGLGAFITLLTKHRDGGPGAVRLAASAALIFLALCAKESAAAWIAVFVGWWAVEKAAGREPTKLLLRAGSAWLASLALFLVVRGSVVGWVPHARPWIDNPLVLEGHAGRVANAICVLARYAAKMIWPQTLTVHYEFDQLAVLPLLPWALVASASVLAVWVALAILLRRVSPAALFLWIFVPAAFAVTSNIAFTTGTLMAERLAYLPLVGACGLGGFALSRIPHFNRFGVPVLALLLVAGGLRAADRSRDYRNKATFVEASVQASPRAVKALYNAGYTRLRAGSAAEALEPLERAVEIWPDYVLALVALSNAHAELGNAALANEYRRRAEDAAERRRSGAGAQ